MQAVAPEEHGSQMNSPIQSAANYRECNRYKWPKQKQAQEIIAKVGREIRKRDGTTGLGITGFPCAVENCLIMQDRVYKQEYPTNGFER